VRRVVMAGSRLGAISMRARCTRLGNQRRRGGPTRRAARPSGAGLNDERRDVRMKSRRLLVRGLSLRRPAPCRLCLSRGTEPALRFSALTLVVTVLHDNALIISAAGLVIDALALSADVAFDRATGRRFPIAARGAHRFGGRINFSRRQAIYR
jgi:hypothetical protein